MKFSLGKRTQDSSIHQETLDRWRENSEQADAADESEPVFHLTDVNIEQPEAASRESSSLTSQIERSVRPPVSTSAGETSSVTLDFSNIKTALGSGTVIDGKLSFEEPVRIDGTLTGEVHSSSVLVVGEQGSVDATLEVQGLIVLGNASGEITATDFVDVRENGRLEGNLKVRRLMLEEGGHFDGKCSMSKAA